MDSYAVEIPTETKLWLAIKHSYTIDIMYRGKEYVFEPYLLYCSHSQKMFVHGWKNAPDIPGWCTFRVEYIQGLSLGEKFLRPHKGFNRTSHLFHKIVFFWKENYDSSDSYE